MISKEEFLKNLEDDEYSPGWQAIDDACEKVYPEGGDDHYATSLASRSIFGGDEYLDGFSVWHNKNGYKHIVSYGMTTLYGDEAAYGREWNGWGYEMTMKIKEEKTEDCLWVMNMMSNLARYTYRSKRYFEEKHYVIGDGSPIKIGCDTLITSLLVVYDTELETQTSVYGKTEFLQLVGITKNEMDAILKNPDNIDVLLKRMKDDGNPDLVTDLKRTKEYLW